MKYIITFYDGTKSIDKEYELNTDSLKQAKTEINNLIKADNINQKNKLGKLAKLKKMIGIIKAKDNIN